MSDAFNPFFFFSAAKVEKHHEPEKVRTQDTLCINTPFLGCKNLSNVAKPENVKAKVTLNSNYRFFRRNYLFLKPNVLQGEKTCGIIIL